MIRRPRTRPHRPTYAAVFDEPHTRVDGEGHRASPLQRPASLRCPTASHPRVGREKRQRRRRSSLVGRLLRECFETQTTLRSDEVQCALAREDFPNPGASKTGRSTRCGVRARSPVVRVPRAASQASRQLPGEASTSPPMPRASNASDSSKGSIKRRTRHRGASRTATIDADAPGTAEGDRREPAGRCASGVDARGAASSQPFTAKAPSEVREDSRHFGRRCEPRPARQCRWR